MDDVMTARWHAPAPAGPSLVPTTVAQTTGLPVSGSPVCEPFSGGSFGAAPFTARVRATGASVAVRGAELRTDVAIVAKAANVAYNSTTRPSPPLRGPR